MYIPYTVRGKEEEEGGRCANLVDLRVYMFVSTCVCSCVNPWGLVEGQSECHKQPPAGIEQFSDPPVPPSTSASLPWVIGFLSP